MIRWLLSTVGSTMLFDDHDVHDDWNISIDWLEEMRAKPWWHDRITGALVSYWAYQHLGNLSPKVLAEMDLLRETMARDDAWPLLRDWAEEADRGSQGTPLELLADPGPYPAGVHGLARGTRAGPTAAPDVRRR